MQPTVLTLLAAGHLPGLVTMVSAQAVSGRDVDCMFFTSPTSHDATCETFAAAWGLSVDDLTKLNPGIVCPGLDTSKAYCVIGTVTEDPAQVHIDIYVHALPNHHAQDSNNHFGA